MIKEIDFTRLALLCEPHTTSKKNDVLLVRLISNALCFSKNGLCTIYEIENGGKTCGVMCRYGGGITVCLFKRANFSELCDFLSVAPITIIECDAATGRKIARKLNMRKLSGKALYIKKPKKFLDYKVTQTQNVSEFFDVLKVADPYYKNTSYEEYYCDVFYRSDLPARLFLAEFDGKRAATAAVMHEYKNISIISDVSVLPELRRRGLGGSITAKVCSALISEGKTPTLLCTSKNAERVYAKIGFKVCGKFSLLSTLQNTKDEQK